MRVFVGFSDVAGFASRLSALLAKAGHEVELINSSPNYLNPSVVRPDRLHETAPGLFRFAKRLKKGCYPVYFLLSPLLNLAKFCVYWGAVRRSEVTIFLGCGDLLPGFLERRLAKWMGRRTINVFLGSASRPVILGGSGLHMADKSPAGMRKLAKKLRRQERRVRQIAAICDEIVENPLCSQFQPGPCVDWFRLGFPSGGELFGDVSPWQGEASSETVTILHCPSKPRIKGTDRIRAAIELLREEGLPINYVEITGMPHAEVLKRLAECDFVIDELYSDSPLAGFASEAAWFGKPAVVGGYGWDVLERLPSGEWLPPSLTCRPEELEKTVRNLILNRELRTELGARAREYLDRFLGSPAYVERFDKALCGDVPCEWYFDPRDISYVHGLGQNEQDLRRGLRRYVDTFGVEGLCFGERQDLVDAVRSLIDEGSGGVENSGAR